MLSSVMLYDLNFCFSRLRGFSQMTKFNSESEPTLAIRDSSSDTSLASATATTSMPRTRTLASATSNRKTLPARAGTGMASG